MQIAMARPLSLTRSGERRPSRQSFLSRNQMAGWRPKETGASFVQRARLTRYVGILKTWATSFVLRMLGVRYVECGGAGMEGPAPRRAPGRTAAATTAGRPSASSRLSSQQYEIPGEGREQNF